MYKLLLGVLLIASLLPTTVLYAASLSAVSLAAQQTVMTELAKLEKNNGKYIRSSKLQALKLIKDAIEKNPELAASLTSFVISQGVGVSASVTTPSGGGEIRSGSSHYCRCDSSCATRISRSYYGGCYFCLSQTSSGDYNSRY